ncbi:phage tail protein [Planomicrobium chinense]|uniref:phage tail protein n=1 Tax=Planococcus chinensis TaxID=272917 RepID=UPI001CC36C93|nr:phage tail protein [Planococcus chinensis]MBZ5203190.1 phage tail protein [Planococcus chinensis]
MIAITDIMGETRQVTGIKTAVRSRKVNGEKTVSLVVIPTETNGHSFESVDTESRFTFQGEPYIIKKVQEKSVGRVSIKTAEAVHSFFDDMINSFQYETFTGSQTFAAALQRVFGPTAYSFSIVDSFTAEQFENFGSDNCLALFQKVLERYGAEFEVIGMRVYLKRKIGQDTGFQLRWKHNIKSIEKQVDTEGLATIIRGFGGTPNDAGKYPIEREYRSNVELFGELHASAVYNESLSTVAGMDAHLAKTLVSEPQLSITVDISTVDGVVKNEGDRGYIFYDPMKIKVEARVVEITETFEYADRKWKARQSAVTLSNLRNKLTDVTTRFAQTTKRVDRLFDGREPLPYNVLPEAIRTAAEAINNSLTEVQYPPGQGITLQDPKNPLIMVRLTSAGIGLSTNGGVTYRTAMTGVGIVADEIVTGVLRANNVTIQGEKNLFFWDGTGLWAYNPSDMTKYVKLSSAGLYIAKGAVTIERPDGFKIISNGMSAFDVNIQGAEPTFHSPGVTLVQRSYAQWLSTRSQQSVDFNQYSFEHKARYLKVRYRVLADPGNTAHFEIWRNGEIVASAYTAQSDEYSPGTLDGYTLTVDLGVPTGQPGSFQIRIRSEVEGKSAYAMVSRKWLEG